MRHRQLSIVSPDPSAGRELRDRLEILEALIAGPGFEGIYRDDVIHIPRFDRVYAWGCDVPDCEGVQRGTGLCDRHTGPWLDARSKGVPRTEFLAQSEPFTLKSGYDVGVCLICPERPAERRHYAFCSTHHNRWKRRGQGHLSMQEWARTQTPLDGFGDCQVGPCVDLAASPLGLCAAHRQKYWNQGSPGGAVQPRGWALKGDSPNREVAFSDRSAFFDWCRRQQPMWRVGTVNLLGLHPLVKAEIKWGIWRHAQAPDQARWDFGCLQVLANVCREMQVESLLEVERGAARFDDFNSKHNNGKTRMAVSETAAALRCTYLTKEDTKQAGFIETDQFGRRFNSARSHFDLSSVKQRWLRDLLWDYLAAILESVDCPRSRGPFDNYRRAAVELSAFLEVDLPDGGHDPTLLTGETASRFVADMRHRERHKMPSLGLRNPDGSPPIVSDIARQNVFNHLRKMMLNALETHQADRIGLSSTFIAALPAGGKSKQRSRSPYSDEVFAALVDPANLQRLHEEFDPSDMGIRDAWEAIMLTGRRCSEVLSVGLDCAQMHNGRHYMWHDQTKVGKFDEGIIIPPYLYDLLQARRAKTLQRFEDRNGRPATDLEQRNMALFPAKVTNKSGIRPMPYGTFSPKFRLWVRSLDLGTAVPHQARHTLATRLLGAGATLTHIRDYLGHVSERMAEHYTHVVSADLVDVLQTVWVGGPGTNIPGKLLAAPDTTLNQAQATAMAIDLSRRSTPAQGGLCTFQPVVEGRACPWDLNCETCDKFVLSGADLLYWRRKEEQWRSIAERAPDDATADYLHSVFDPTAKAIRGLESALSAMGLLEEALSLDLRRPQDYFQKVWSVNFRASELSAAMNDDEIDEEETA